MRSLRNTAFQTHASFTRSFRPAHFASGRHSAVASQLPHRKEISASAETTTRTGRRARLPANLPGDVYVSAACIDCDTCRWLAPETFSRADGMSYVATQPESHEQRVRAVAAAVACPTGAILTEKPAKETREGRSFFPLAVNDEKSVYYLGYTNEDTFGASSWLVFTPSACIMMDVPRYNSGLAKRIEKLIKAKGRAGSVDYIVLSHSDDVAGHTSWSERFPEAKRVIHKVECNHWQRTDECEIKLELGEGDNADRLELAKGVVIIHVPGHTEGSIALLDEASKSLFTGDHLFYTTRVNALFGSTEYSWHSWSEQQKSVSKLADEPFLSIYPGHDRMHKFASDEDRRKGIAATVALMKKTPCRKP